MVCVTGQIRRLYSFPLAFAIKRKASKHDRAERYFWFKCPKTGPKKGAPGLLGSVTLRAEASKLVPGSLQIQSSHSVNEYCQWIFSLEACIFSSLLPSFSSFLHLSSFHNDYSTDFQSFSERLTGGATYGRAATTNWVRGCPALPFKPTQSFLQKIPAMKPAHQSTGDCGYHFIKENEAHHGFPTKINQKCKGIRIRTVCEAANN